LSQASKLTSASVAGIVPQPLHWNRPPQSPVWQCPTPLWKTQPVRPQNRVFRLFGVLIVTLFPGGSTQPLAASGVLGLGAAATQMVSFVRLTNVTSRRLEPAAPEGSGLGAAGAAGEDADVDVAGPAAIGILPLRVCPRRGDGWRYGQITEIGPANFCYLATGRGVY
jgi:hypothetical protein